MQAIEHLGAAGDQVVPAIREQAQGRRVALDAGSMQLGGAAGASELLTASAASVFRPCPFESGRTRAESSGGTSTTASPSPRSRCARGVLLIRALAG
jgi:hypothetical protein